MEQRQRNWKRLLKQHKQLLLPSACDALTAKLIQQAGFPAYQIGGFALDGMRFGFPDMDVTRLGEKSAAVRDIVHASDLPVLVEKSPKKCGHMGGKEVVEPQVMINKLRAAQSARRSKESLFILARTDALAVNGLKDALKRAEQYLKAGADGIYIEGPENLQQLRAIGKEFKGEPLAVTILENGGKTPWVSPEKMYAMGFSMVLYPTTLLFRQTRAVLRGLEDLKAGRPLPKQEAVSMMEFEKIVDIAYWKAIEQKAIPMGERVRQAVNKLVKKIA
jgi:2-methylisocitrate lyase-like PEP mutase family enzyme